MEPETYAQSGFTLQFLDPEVERSYRDYILERTMIFCRLAWGVIIFLGTVFAAGDRSFFGEDAGTVLLMRVALIAFAAGMIGLTFAPRLRPILAHSAALFITATGVFCILQTALSDPTEYTPFFTGLYLAFAGIFSTAGLGFRSSLVALVLNLVVFNLALGVVAPVSGELLFIYDLFLAGGIVVFGFSGYLIESTLRDNYVTQVRLENTLAEVKQLSGLLPICSSCKNIRDDQGYWSQIEVYIREHSEADFSHGMCPECVSAALASLPVSH